MNIAALIPLIYGIFNIVGGCIGYFKAGSLASLIAGGVSGILLVVCSLGIQQNQKAAVIGALVVSLLLCARFGMTIMKQFKVMPDLIIIVFGIATIVLMIGQLSKG